VRIGINALFLIPGQVGGSETYLRSLVRALGELDRSNEYVLYTNREAAGSFGALPFREVRCPLHAANRVARLAYEQLAMPVHAARDRLDVLHSPGYTGPLALPCASVVSILDLNYHFHPEDWSTAGLWANRLLIPRVARRATRIVTISECSRRAIVDVLGVPESKLSVSLLGVDGNLVAPAPARDVRATLGLDRPYLLTVTASHPHKNVDGLFRAYELVCRDWRDPPPLVVVGIRGRHQERLEAIVRGWSGGGRIVFPGYVDAPTLAALYHEAHAFVFASKYEGFGIPVLEAMSAGVPVVSSNRASLPEVCGDAAVLVDPDDLPAFAAELRRIWDDTALRARQIARGHARAGLFTWQRTAEATLDAYTRAYQSS
jgi:glycosyltransferase involved in cell wall biosynthesis